jgi:hypothetical protein
MYLPPPDLTATLQALYGESDPLVVAPALGDIWFARILALAPGVHPIVSALGALAGRLPSLLPPGMTDSPALHAAIAVLIGTDAGDNILEPWAEIAPIGWGATHAAALIDAVQRNHCASWAAAALIGPGDVSAALLTWVEEIAPVIQHWGQTTPNDPTAWMNHLGAKERRRFLDALSGDPYYVAVCLPWLPKKHAEEGAELVLLNSRDTALEMYADASPIARAHHAAILSELIQCAGSDDLAALTRLAVATGMNDAWDAVLRLLPKSSDKAVDVVTAAPWDMLRADVQRSILSAADADDVCAAIAFARGECHAPPTITPKTARPFFAAVTPTVWRTLPKSAQQDWIAHLDVGGASLAIRSLGPNPAFLVNVALSNDLIPTVRRHIPDDATMRQTLLPTAVRDLPISAVPAIGAALAKDVSDTIAAVQIASKRIDAPPAVAAWMQRNSAPHAWSAAATILRVAARLNTDRAIDRSAALAAVFDGWSFDETNALLAALPNDVRAALHPDHNVLADALAHPDRRDAFRKALGALDALPPSVAIPAHHALATLAATSYSEQRRLAGEGLAIAVRNHGRLFLDIIESCSNDVIATAFPVTADIRDLAAADPLVAQRLAQALRLRNATDALDALMAAPLQEMRRFWQLLPVSIQRVILGKRDALTANVAMTGRKNALAQTLREWSGDSDVLLLALRMLCDSEEKRRTWGVALLAQHPDLAGALLPLLREDLRTMLASVPVIAAAGADLPPMKTTSPTMRRRR